MLDLAQFNDLLGRENVRCGDVEVVKQKLAQMKAAGNKSLQVLADFDYTISHLRYKDDRKSSSFGALEKYSGMSEQFRESTLALYNHYYPLEVDPTIPSEEKVKLMTEWFTRSAGLIIEAGVSEELVRTAADHSKVQLRERFGVFVERLRSKEVPLMIFSAGVGQVIQRVLQTADIRTDDIKLLANMLEYDENGRAHCFRPPLITTGNKSTVARNEIEYFNSHCERVNTILLGDNIEDVQMASCVREYSKNVLTVGFLNDRVEDRMDLYTSTFDIVLLNDPDFGDVIELFDSLQ